MGRTGSCLIFFLLVPGASPFRVLRASHIVKVQVPEPQFFQLVFFPDYCTIFVEWSKKFLAGWSNLLLVGFIVFFQVCQG